MLRGESNNNYTPRQFSMDDDLSLQFEQGFFSPAATGDPVFGIDLGSRKIRGVAGIINAKGKVDVLGMAEADSAGITRGLITEPEETAKAINTVVNDLSLFSNVPVNNVFVSIAGTYTKRFTYKNISSRKKPEKEIVKEELLELLDEMHDLELQPGDIVIHFFPQKFFVDGVEVADVIGMTGKKLEVEMQVVTGNAEVSDSIHHCLRKSGLHIASLIPGYMSAASANLSEEEKKEGVVLLDIGAGATYLVIFSGGYLRYSAVIPFGSNSITEDVKNGCMVMRTEAELLKVKSGFASAELVKKNEIATIPGKNGEPKEVSVKNLAQIIQARIEEILDMAMLEIKNSGLEKEIKKGLVLTGGGAQLKQLDLMVQKHTGLPARIGYSIEHLSNGIDIEMRNPTNSTSIGLIIKGNETRKYQQKENGKKLINTVSQEKKRNTKK